jgi:hypothetical protein
MAQFAALLPYPLTIFTADERETIELADAAEVAAFAASAVGAVLAMVGAGQAAKAAILAAETPEDVDAALTAFQG